MPFVCDFEENDRGKVVATFPQGAHLGAKAGDAAEGIFPMYPALVFTAKVIDTIDITSGGQVPVGGTIPDIPSSGAPRFAAILKLDEPICGCRQGPRRRGGLFRQGAICRHVPERTHPDR